jgi:hypothetical protein
MPGLEEHVDSRGPYVSYGYGAGYKGIVATIILSKGGVKLGVVGGGALPDPHRLLQGDGKVHRHIVLNDHADLRRPGIRPLLRASHRACLDRLKQAGLAVRGGRTVK